MTLKETIQAVEAVAARQPSVNMIVQNDVFRLNGKADARYGVFAWLQKPHMGSIDANTIDYAFTFFYVDRLKADKSNQIEVQSVGIQVLDNIIKTLDDMGLYSTSSYSFQVFNQRFLDECAGVYADVKLSVPAGSLCADNFADFNMDYNEDFMIY